MPLKQRRQDLADAAPLLEADIREGRFTPFLGAGASSLWAREKDLNSYPWKEVAITLAAISSKLSGRSRDFLRSFTQHRLNISPADTSWIVPSINGPRSPIDDRELSESLLVNLQAELVRATVRLTNYFGVRFSQENPSIHLIEEYGVEFDLNSEDVGGALARDCLPRLLAAAGIALELQDKRWHQRESPFLVQIAGAHRCLELRRLYDKLLALILCLVGTNREAYREDLDKHRIAGQLPISNEEEQTKVATFGKLRLDAIQWLSDLLWYTVRYWVPCYPTTAELAFELSLAVKDAPPRRAELAQAAQALENLDAKLAAEIVGNLVEYCEIVQERKEGPDRQTKAFYYSIAAALQFQFEQYREARNRDVLGEQSHSRFRDLDDDGNGKREVPVTIVFTTNFDNALERVFEANEISFHIVFPVVRGSVKNTKEAPRWLIGTRTSKHWEIRDWWSICDQNGKPNLLFEGPVIVKLHGSPSLEIDDNSQHCLVLSEFSYLQALASRAPYWLDQQLARGFREQTGRSLWFLGYSISDWNVRLRLYEDFSELHGLRHGWSTVTQDADVYRSAILERLGVDRHLGDLNDLPGIVLRVLDDALKSSEVTTLLLQLKEVY